ncbi:hypothetical protein LCGC14_2612220, partial [marine sediment metagenome]
MAEDFTTYTESDVLGRLSQTSTRSTITAMQPDDNQTWLQNDKGAGFFSGNFSHKFTLRIDSFSAFIWQAVWGITNNLDDIQGIIDNSQDGLFIELLGQTNRIIEATEVNAGSRSGTASGSPLSSSTTYYLTVERDESVGSFGTLSVRVYSNAARTSLVSSSTLTLNVANDFRYIFAPLSYDRTGGEVGPFSGYVEDLVLAGGDAPTVTTDELITQITDTTSQSFGEITSIGGALVTQRGHAWDTSSNPDLTKSKTELGGQSLPGLITSQLTGLTPGTLYHTRAYATNANGTSFGEDRTFTTLGVGDPTVTTQNISSLTETTATGNATVLSIGDSDITQHGHVWATSVNPDTTDSKTQNGLGFVGAFTSSITG